MRVDTQGKIDKRNIYLQEVGVSDVYLPLQLKLNDNVEAVSAKLTMAGSLRPEQKGIHMSRFLRKFNEYKNKILAVEELVQITSELKNWERTDRLYMRIETDIYLEKKTPITELDTYSRYPIKLYFIAENDEIKFQAKIDILITSLCPASKENSKHGAHNQRSLISVTIDVDHPAAFDITEIIRTVERNASCEIYEILKLEDEKYVTEKAYENPKFVEDLARDMYLAIEKLGYKHFEIEVTNYESIHEHNAYCIVSK